MDMWRAGGRWGLTVARGGDVGPPRVGQHLPVSDDPDTDLVGAALEADHHRHDTN